MSNLVVKNLPDALRGKAELPSALATLDVAVRGLGLVLHDAPHADVLMLAQRLAVSAYDARCLALAKTLGQRVVTEDLPLGRKAPHLTQSLADALAA